MKLRNLFYMALCAALVLALAACGANQTSSPGTSQTQNAANVTEEQSSEEQSSAGGKVLVAYFSGTGNTKRVAEALASATGGDLFEIEPQEPYTADDLNYRDEQSRVSREHDDESLRGVPLVNAAPENWEDYDTVFIGYPIWWQIAAWPVDGFVTANDFSGKTVIPFATSASSPMGDSGTLLSELADGGDWQEGRRFASNASEDDVAAWAKELGLAEEK